LYFLGPRCSNKRIDILLCTSRIYERPRGLKYFGPSGPPQPTVINAPPSTRPDVILLYDAYTAPPPPAVIGNITNNRRTVSSLFIAAVVRIKDNARNVQPQCYNRNDNNSIIQTHCRVRVYTKRVKYCAHIRTHTAGEGRGGKWINKRKPTGYTYAQAYCTYVRVRATVIYRSV